MQRSLQICSSKCLITNYTKNSQKLPQVAFGLRIMRIEKVRMGIGISRAFMALSRAKF